MGWGGEPGWFCPFGPKTGLRAQQGYHRWQGTGGLGQLSELQRWNMMLSAFFVFPGDIS